MKWLKVGLAAFILCVLFEAAPAHALSSVVPYTPPASLADSPVIITGYSISGAQLSYVQLYNSSDVPVNLADWQMNYFIAGQTDPLALANLAGWIAPGNYLVVGDLATVADADFPYQLDVPAVDLPLKLQLTPSPASQFAVHEVPLGDGGIYVRDTSDKTGEYLSKFTVQTVPPTLYGNGFYTFPDEIALQVSEILANPQSCSPLDTSAACGDYVKLYNPTDQAVDLSSLRLRVGYKGQNPTSSNTYLLSGKIAPGHYKTITKSADNRPLSVTNSGGFVWLEDTYGLKQYDATVQSYADASSKKGQAWAYDANDGAWKWTTQPTPDDAPSVFPVVPAKVTTATARTLVPCKSNQYRSPETNRCRLLASAESASLKPCAANQTRNLETNRCRKIGSTASTLTPCKENQERNPDTNRCRNKVGDIPKAAFSVEPVKEAGKTFIGWWALGGVGVLAVGYGAWEWRREMLGGIRKVGAFFTGRK